MRLRRIFVGVLAQLQPFEKRQQQRAGDRADDQSDRDPERNYVQQRARIGKRAGEIDARAVHASDPWAKSGFWPSPRHFKTTTGVCSSPLPCGLSSNARSTARRSTPADAPSTLAFSKSLASTTAHATCAKSSIDRANASGSRGANTMARSYGG